MTDPLADPRTWQTALRLGKRRRAVLKWLVYEYGAELSRWCRVHTLARRVVADANRFSQEHGLGLTFRASDPTIRDALAEIRFIISHGAHVSLGVPKHTWRERAEDYHMGLEAGAAKAEAYCEDRRRDSLASNALQAAQAAGQAVLAHDMRRRGLAVREIARRIGTAHTTVQRYLARPDPAASLGGGTPTT